MPIPSGARTRFFHLDAERFAASATGAPTGDDAWRDPTSRCRSLAPGDLDIELFDQRTVSVQGVKAEQCTMQASPIKGIATADMSGTSTSTSWIGQAKVDGSILVSASFAIVSAPDAPVVVIGSIDDATGHYGVQPAAEDGLTVLYKGDDPVLREPNLSTGDGADPAPDPNPDAGAPGSTGPVESETPSSTTTVPATSTTAPGPSAGPSGAQNVVGHAATPPANAEAMRTVSIAVVYGNGVSATNAIWHAASGAVGTNASLLNSDLPVEVEIVGSPVHSDYDQTDLLTDITRFQTSNDPYLNEIHLMRPGWDADLGLLVLPGDAPGECAGVGYVPQTAEGQSAAAFSVQDLFGCNNTVMAHEVGHNLGAHHDPANSHDPGDPVPELPYSFLFGHFISTKGRDNMAYDTLCAAPCPTKPQYADPDIDFIGLPGYPSGTATRRAADSIRRTSWGTSQLYPLTSNDHIWTNDEDRTHGSVNIDAGTGDDPEAPFVAIGGNFSSAQGEVFWYLPDNGPDFLTRFFGSALTPAKYSRPITGSYVPVSGNFNGDGRDDIFWHAPGAGTDWVWWGTTSSPDFGDAGFTASFNVSGTYTPTAGDFDGDGRDDILWYSATGQDSIWWGQASSSAFGTVSSPVTIGPDLDPISGDFDGDGRDDLLLYGRGSTPDSIWWGQAARSSFGGVGTTSSRTMTGTYQPAAGDFDGDGRTDVMLYGPGANSDYLWWGHATRSTFGPGSQTTTSITGTYASPIPGDYDGNSIDDLYWFAYG